MQTLALPVFEFTELDASAQAKAREKLREIAHFDEWWDSVYDDADTSAQAMGITIDRREFRGRSTPSPDIRFSGFWSQGDGASFTGRVSPTPDIGGRIRSHAANDQELHLIADHLAAIYAALPAECSARIERHSSRYVHDNTTYVEFDNDDAARGSVDQRHALEALTKRFMRWIYKQLEREFDGLQSDEALADLAVGLSLVFTADGEDVTRIAGNLQPLTTA